MNTCHEEKRPFVEDWSNDVLPWVKQRGDFSGLYVVKLTFIGLNMKLLFLDGRAPLATDMFICNGRIWR